MSYTEVFVWGFDNFGQLGIGTKQGSKTYRVPRPCKFDIVIKQISCGEEHSAFLAERGMIFTMGSNVDGRLGIGDKNIPYVSTPCLIESLYM